MIHYQLPQELGVEKYAVCAPAHKAAFQIGAVTVYSLFTIDTHTHTYQNQQLKKCKSRRRIHIYR
jgi:hypothetical protein